MTIPPVLRMSDPGAISESYLPVFIDMTGSFEPEAGETALFDIERLDVSRPTLTRKTRDYLGPELTLRMPTAFTLGVDWAIGSHRLVLNGVRYAGSLGVEGKYGRENGEIQPFRIAARPSWGLRGGLELAGRRDEGGLGWLSIPLRILLLDLDGLVFSLMDDRVEYRDVRYRFSGGLT